MESERRKSSGGKTGKEHGNLTSTCISPRARRPKRKISGPLSRRDRMHDGDEKSAARKDTASQRMTA